MSSAEADCDLPPQSTALLLDSLRPAEQAECQTPASGLTCFSAS